MHTSFLVNLKFYSLSKPKISEDKMSEPQVTGLRSIEYNVPDAARTSRFYEECWGLSKVAEKNGAHYLRATGDEHHIVVLHQGSQSCVKRINFTIN